MRSVRGRVSNCGMVLLGPRSHACPSQFVQTVSSASQFGVAIVQWPWSFVRRGTHNLIIRRPHSHFHQVFVASAFSCPELNPMVSSSLIRLSLPSIAKSNAGILPKYPSNSESINAVSFCLRQRHQFCDFSSPLSSSLASCSLLTTAGKEVKYLSLSRLQDVRIVSFQSVIAEGAKAATFFL